MAIDLTKIGVDALEAVTGFAQGYRRPSIPRVDNTSGDVVGISRPGFPRKRRGGYANASGAWGNSGTNLYNGIDRMPG